MKKDFWEKGKAFDLWSIPHFIFGMIMALLPFTTNLSLAASFALMLLLAILWELYEKIIKINETLTNNMFDVILPVISFIFVAMILGQTQISKESATVILGALIVVYLFTNISGWLAFRRRQKEFMN